MLGQLIRKLGDFTITTAQTQTGDVITGLGGMQYLVVSARFTYGSGGTSCRAYVQTSLDQGASWIDLIFFEFLTTSATRVLAVQRGVISTPLVPTDAALTTDILDPAPLGDRLRVKVVSTGTYAGSTLLSLRGLAA